MSGRSRRGYDSLARWYAPLERAVFGGRLQRARCLLLDELVPFRSALVLGDGDGRLLAELTRRFPASTFVSLDHSRRMLSLQQRAVSASDHERVTWVHGDVRHDVWPPGTFDLLVTAFITDCFDDSSLRSLVPRWTSWMRPEANWLHVDFVMPSRGGRRVAAGLTSLAMHAFFRWQTGLARWHLSDPDPVICGAGWVAASTRFSQHPFVRARLYVLSSALCRRPSDSLMLGSVDARIR